MMNWGWLLAKKPAPIDAQQARIAQLEADAVIAERTVESLQRHCNLLADRYDKIRETNEQLRDALELYREDHRRY